MSRAMRARRLRKIPASAAWTAATLAVAFAGTDISPLQAQQSISVGAGFGRFTGGDFSGTPAGPTVGAALHVPLAAINEIALGIDYSRYGDHGFVGATTQLDYSATLRRRVWAPGPDVLLGIRIGYSTRSLSIVDEPARTDGFLMGPSLSLRRGTSVGAGVDVSFDLLYHAYEELIMYASREYGTDQDGFRFLVRIGVMLPVPGLDSSGTTSRPGW